MFAGEALWLLAVITESPESQTRRMNPMLAKALGVTVALHVIAAFVAAVVTVATHVIKDDAQFEEPPAVEQIKPPAEVRVQIKPQAPKPQPLQQLKMRPIANVAIAEVDVDLPSMSDTFTVSAGLGNSIGRGNLLGGTSGRISLGLSSINVFGLESRAERVMFVVDGSKEMVTDDKGGLYSYRVIKDEITTMVGNLSSGTLFNVMVYNGKSTKLFRPQLVSANAAVTQELEEWFAPVNASIDSLGVKGATRKKLQTFPLILSADQTPEDVATERGSSVLSDQYIQWCMGYTSGYANIYLTQLMLEQQIDAAFWITGKYVAIGRIERPQSEEAKVRRAEELKQLEASPEYQEKRKAHDAEKREMESRIKAALDKENKARARNGQPPKVLTGDIYKKARELGLTWRTEPPGGVGFERRYITEDRIQRYFKSLVKAISGDGATVPSINVVLFLAGDESISESRKEALEDYVKFFKGKHRIIRGENEIKNAATSATAGANP